MLKHRKEAARHAAPDARERIRRRSGSALGHLIFTGYPLVNHRRNAMLQRVRLPIHGRPKIVFSLFTALVFVTSIAVAELPPYVYKQWQQDAPEALIIKVLSVETITRDENEERKIVFVTVQAQVQSVWRSKSGIRPETAISISYEHTQHKRPHVGPSQVPILETGEECPAYLKKDEQSASYSPVAGGYSFETMK
jgi:hypothetical protein